MVNGTNLNFREQLQNEYGDKIVIGKRDVPEMIKFLKEVYGAEVVAGNNLDFNASHLLQEFINNLATCSDITIFSIPRSDNTEMYYQYYHDRFEGEGSVYIFLDSKANIWNSNCDLLSHYIEIQLGIEESDIRENGRNYLDYLNNFYMLDFLQQGDQ